MHLWTVLAAGTLLALLSACKPDVTFGIDGRSGIATPMATELAVQFAAPDDDRVTAQGPHAVGASVPIVATRGFGPVDLWDVEVGPSSQGTLERRYDNGNDMRLEIALMQAGTTTVEVFGAEGGSRGTLDLQARPVAGATLVAYGDVVVGSSDLRAIDSESTIRLVEGGRTTLAVVWLDADGVPLTGTGLLEATVIHPLDSVRLLAAGSGDVPALDSISLEGRRETLEPAELTVYAGGEPVGSWRVDVVPESAVTAIELVEQESYGILGRVGYLYAIATDADGQRVLGLNLQWSNNGEPLFGAGPYVELVSGCESYIEGCAPVSGQCVGKSVLAEARFVGSSVARQPLFRCSHGPPAGASGCAIALLGALALARRRRKAAVALLAALLAVSPAARAQDTPETAPGEESAAEDEVASEEETAPEEPVEGDDSEHVLGEGVGTSIVDEEAGLTAEFTVLPVVQWGLHTPVNATNPVRSNLVLGASARFGFHQKLIPIVRLAGAAQAGFTGMLGSKRSGWELRTTALAGPQFGTGEGQYRLAFTPMVGFELIVDRYRFYCRPFGTAFSFSLPIMARARLAFLILEGGVAPSFFIAPGIRERVDWKISDVKGFGDEFEFRAAATINADKFKLGVNLRTRVASYGDETWLGFGLAYSAFF